MEEGYLLKKIRMNAKNKVAREWKDFVNDGYKKFGGLKINGKYVFGGDSSGRGNTENSHLSYWLDDMIANGTETNAKEILENEIKKTEENMVNELMGKIGCLGYLFKDEGEG